MQRISLIGIVILLLSPFSVSWAQAPEWWSLSSWTSDCYVRMHWEQQATPNFMISFENAGMEEIFKGLLIN